MSAKIDEAELRRREACYFRAKRELDPNREYRPQEVAAVLGVSTHSLSRATFLGTLPAASVRRFGTNRAAETHASRTILGRHLIEYARQRWLKAVRSLARTRTKPPTKKAS